VALRLPQDLLSRLWWLYALAAASFLPTLLLPYIGEEGVYTITSLEMWHGRDFFVSTLYGVAYGRPPLYNWMIIPLANLLGWDHVLIAARSVTAAATVASGLILAWLAANLTGNRTLAALAAAVYLSGDALFYRGWLAYSDPLFSLFVFASIACLWIGLERDRASLIWLGVAAVTCAFLTKVQTAYLFYGFSLLVLCTRRDLRARLLRPWPIAAHAAGAAAFVAWHFSATRGANLEDTTYHLLHKASTFDPGAYLGQLGSFPLETLSRFLPASVLAAWFWYRDRHRPRADAAKAGAFPLAMLVGMLALNWLPYWLGPGTHIRYVLPLYPLFALLLAWIIWRAGEMRIRQTVYWLAAAVALKYVFAVWALPLHQSKFRGDQMAAAESIERRTRGFPLYASDFSAAGLAVSARLDERRYPAAPLHQPPADWTDAFVLSYTPEERPGKVAEVISLRNDRIYLNCRGSACR
jgi:4-amino-4-deoxy-L-arabinose transferase-like glycosyltransferase